VIMNIPIYKTEEELKQEKIEVFCKGIALGCAILFIIFLIVPNLQLAPQQDKSLILNVQIEGIGVLDFYPSPESSRVFKKFGTNGFVISGLSIKRK